MTTITAKKDIANINRAPRGGAISPVNGLYYRGGCFMPAEPIELAKPAKLQGSQAQILWANRLRAQALANLDEMILGRRVELAEAKVYDEAGVRRGLKKDLVMRHRLMTTQHAATVIDQRNLLR